jgi:hypothetical protein
MAVRRERWLSAGNVIAVSRLWLAGLAGAGRLLGRSESAVADTAPTRRRAAPALVVRIAAGYVAW